MNIISDFPVQDLNLPIKEKENLRIGIVSDAITGRNGVGTYYLDLMHALRPFVEYVEIISPQSKKESEIVSFTIPLPGDKTQFLAIPKIGAFSKKLDDMKLDVIILPALGPYTFLAFRYGRSHKIPIIIANHTNFDQLLSLYLPKFLERPLRFILKKLLNMLYNKSSGIVFVDNVDFENNLSECEKPKILMGTPLEHEFLSQPLIPMQTEINRVIFVGRLAPEKGLQKILDAASALSNLQFDIVGDGPLYEEIKSKTVTIPNVTLWGWQPRSKVRSLIDRAEILILPSEYETFGTVALEALARHRFVLVSENCGISRWAELASGLFTIPNSGSLTSSLIEFQNMPVEKRNDHAQQAWLAIEEFQKKVIEDWSDFLVNIGNDK